MKKIQILAIFCFVCLSSGCARIYKYQEIESNQKSLEFRRWKAQSCFKVIKGALEDDDWEVYTSYNSSIDKSIKFRKGEIAEDKTSKFARKGLYLIPRYKMIDSSDRILLIDQKYYRTVFEIENSTLYNCPDLANIVLEAVNKKEIYDYKKEKK